MKRNIIIGIIVILLGIVGYSYSVYDKNLRGAGPALFNTTPPADIADIIEKNNQLPPGQNNTDFPLTLPDGFMIEVFARDLGRPRVMLFDEKGNMWVSQTRDGNVTYLEVEDGKVIRQNAIFQNMNNPHGLAFDPNDSSVLYIAEEHRVVKVLLGTEAPPEKIIDLPDDDNHRNHFTRTIHFGPDGKLYLAIGSTCNVCREDFQSKIYVMNKDGSEFKEFARGLRNAVDFTWHPVTGEIWASDNGRDQLGDDIPPDEINIVREGGNYGYPNCYGKNIHDTDFDKNTYVRNPCMEPFELPSYIDLQAHVAPLGIAFVPTDGWPEEYHYDLLVAEHGSWNRTDPVGYKISRQRLDTNGNYLGTEDFIAGWLTEDNQALGRPAFVLTQPGGVAYISDDRAGVIYKVSYVGAENSKQRTVNNFDECVLAGNAVMESYPRQCRHEGKTFVEDLSLEEKKRISDGCFATGCSSQVCSDEEVMTTCEFRLEYACYKTATCERQASGECGWTPSKELQQCLQENWEGDGSVRPLL